MREQSRRSGSWEWTWCPLGDLIQRFEAVWSDEALATHRAASERLYRIKDRAFELVWPLASARPLTEYDVQQSMVKWFEEEGLDHRFGAVRVGSGKRGQPALSADPDRISRQSSGTRLSCWTSGASLPAPGAVFADITWVGFTGARRAGEICPSVCGGARWTKRRNRSREKRRTRRA